MRIISEFKDYYDGVMAYDQDRDLIYHRTPKRIDFASGINWRFKLDKSNAYPFPICRDVSFFARKGIHSVEQRIIGFCGKIYPTLLLYKNLEGKSTPCHNMAEVDKFIQDNFSEEYYQKYACLGKWKKYSFYCQRNDMRKWFHAIEGQEDHYRKLFEDQNCPVFVSMATVDSLFIEYNANLKDTGFVSVFDPWAAYQEISMFMGGLASPNKPIPTIDNDTLIEIKGFDKHSFRKPPQKERPSNG